MKIIHVNYVWGNDLTMESILAVMNTNKAHTGLNFFHGVIFTTTLIVFITARITSIFLHGLFDSWF